MSESNLLDFLRAMNSRMNERFDQIEQQLASLGTRLAGVKAAILSLERTHAGLYQAMVGIHPRLDDLGRRLRRIEARLNLVVEEAP